MLARWLHLRAECTRALDRGSRLGHSRRKDKVGGPAPVPQASLLGCVWLYLPFPTPPLLRGVWGACVRCQHDWYPIARDRCLVLVWLYLSGPHLLGGWAEVVGPWALRPSPPLT